MIKQLTCLLCSGIVLFAIELKITPDKNIDVSSKDVEALKYYVKEKYHFIMNEDGAKRIAKENRILANAYLKEGLLSEFEKRKIKIELEKRFADSYIKKLQRSIKIPYDAIKSYYEDHIEEFKKPDEVKIVRYRFHDYKDAVRFYEGKKEGLSFAKKDLGWRSVKSLKTAYRSFIEKGKENYFIPPIILGKSAYDVLYIEAYRDNKGKFLPFEKVKKKIEDLLYKRTFDRKRAEILEKYR